MKQFIATKENIDSVMDCDFFTIFEQDGEKYIHWNGYIYWCECGIEDGTPYRIVEYAFNMVSVKEWIANGKYKSNECNEYFNSNCRIYIEDCDADKAIEVINRYYNGNPPTIAYDEIENLPVGNYIY